MNVLSVHLKQNSKYFDRVFSKFQFSMGIVNIVPQSNRGPGVQVIYNGLLQMLIAEWPTVSKWNFICIPFADTVISLTPPYQHRHYLQ